MSLLKLASLLAFAALTLSFASCNGGGSSGNATNSIQTAVQDLTTDPDGATTTLTFASDERIANATTLNFECSTGELPISVTVLGDTVTVVWNGVVSPASTVRALGLSGVDTGFHAVTTSNSAAPTFVITNGTQTSPLGGDSFRVDFSGTHVLESEVETLANWTLKVQTTTLDLTGTTIVFDESTQRATFTLGTLANLHASYTLAASGIHGVSGVSVFSTTVAGTATGDTTAPTLISAAQNLSQDEFGRVVDFAFSEPVDPVFSIQLSHFGVTSPDIAVDVQRPNASMLRVTFNNPIVPGVNTVDLTGIVDAHGNALPDVTQAITQPSPLPNAFAKIGRAHV